MTKFLNTDLDTTLGGLTPSDEKVSSQKAIKTYIDTEDAKKVDKTSDVSKIYGTASTGEQTTITYSTSANASTIVQRTSNGNVNVAAPTANSHAATKKYVDDLGNTKVDANTAITASTHTKITYDTKGLVTAGTDIVTSDVTDLTATAAEINVLDGIEATTAELNKLHGVTADTSELNILDGITVSTTELNYVDGVTSSIQDQLNTKVVKTSTISQVYGTDSNGDQTTLTYSTSNVASTIAQRDNNSQVNVNLTPTENTHATSKKYVDDKVSSAISEAVVFKGVVADQIQLPSTGNTNGDLYWITAFVNPTPAGIIAGRSGAAIYKVTGSTGEWNYTQDAIYQPDEQTIKLNTNGKLSVMVSTVANNAITVQNDGLHVDITGKVDKNNAITGATKTKITYDSKGLVTAGTDLVENDIPSLHLSKISDVTATAAEVNVLHGMTASTTELNYVDGVTSSIQNQLNSKVAANTAITGDTKAKITYDSKGLVTAGADLIESDIPSLHLSKVSDVSATATEVNTLSGIQTTTAELNTLHNSNISNADLVKLHTITASTNELNTLTGITATTTELNYTHGVTSNIQTQLDSKVVANNAITGATHTKITYDAKGLVTSGTDITLSDVTDVTATVAEINVLDGITASTTELNYTDGLTGNIQSQLNGKQETLVSGTNIKTFNNTSLLGSGNISITGLPSQTGQSGKYLTTNGTSASWASLGTMATESKDDYVAANTSITGATKCKITYDSKGLVTAGADLQASDIPSLNLTKISDVTATATEVNYLSGVTSAVQTQLNSKAADNAVVHTTGNETINGTKTFNNTLELKNNLSFRSYGTSNSGRLQFRAQPSDNVIRGTIAITDGYSTAGSGYEGFVAQMVARAGSTSSDPFNTMRVSNKGIEYIQEANDGTITGQYIIVDDNGIVPSDRLATSGTTGQLLTKTASGQAWQTFDALPSQSGNSGKYLTTNGTTASWIAIEEYTANEVETLWNSL